MENREQNLKKIKNAGTFAELSGLFSIIAAIGIGAVTVNSGAVEMTPYLLMITPGVIFAIIFFVCGWKIRKGDLLKSKGKLWTITILSAFMIIVGLISSSRGFAIIPAIVLMTALQGLGALKKLSVPSP